MDDHSFPLVRGVELKMHQPEKYSGNPIVERGQKGAPDSKRAVSPTVLREANRWRMWYAARDASKDVVDGMRVAYAESKDGLNWKKPDLGLVEYKGDRHNNLGDAKSGLNTVSVLYDPNAPLSGGELLTKPLRFDGNRLSINFSTSAGGSVRVELQDGEGKPVPGFTLDDCNVQFGDELERVVSWSPAPMSANSPANRCGFGWN